MKPKVLLLCLDMDPTDLLGDQHTGAGHLYVKETLSVLIEHSISTLLITRHNSILKPTFEVVGSVEVRRIQIGNIDKKPKEYLWEKKEDSISLVCNLLDEIHFGPTLIHAIYWYSGAVAIALKERFPVANLMYSIISLGKVKHAWQKTLSEHDYAREISEKMIFEKSRIILAVSDQERENAIELYGVEPQKIKVVARGVDMELFSPLEQSMTPKPLLFVGRLVQSKGYEWLMQVYDCLLDNPSLDAPPLWLFGGDPQEIQKAKETSLISDSLKKASKEGRIMWWGKTPRNHLPFFYAMGGLTCITSHYEPGARVVLESMASGTPIIMTPTGYASELIRDGENGYVATMGDVAEWTSKITQYLLDEKTQQNMSLEARKSVLDFYSLTSFKVRQWLFYKEAF